MMSDQNRIEKFRAFQQLHSQSFTFVLPNAWDSSSARVFQESGFKAIGTTSAGIAMSLGYSDGENISFKKMLEVIKMIVHPVYLRERLVKKLDELKHNLEKNNSKN